MTDLSVKEFYDRASEHFENTFLVQLQWTGAQLEDAALFMDTHTPEEFALKIGKEMGLKAKGEGR